MYLKLILLFFSFLSLSQIVLADSATLNNGGTYTNQQNVDNDDEWLMIDDLNINTIKKKDLKAGQWGYVLFYSI